ncbi:MAG TPA: hypothetical protein VEK80_01345, partial [Kribbellaceae bacterium]|nr:hypothetical protein [Kribbellaceae bacterium]
RLVSGYRAADLYLLGVVVAVAAVPAVVPVLLRPIGALLARSRSTSPAIAGRALQWDPTRVAMPYVGGAALLVLVLAGIGYVAVQRNTDSPVSPPGAAHAVIAEWRDPRPGDFARISAAAGAAWSAPFTEGRTGEHDEPGGHDGPLTVGARCADLARLLPGATCVAGSPFVLPPATSQRLASVLAVVAHEQSAAVLLRPPAELVDADGAIFVDDAPIGELAERVRTAAAGLVPASTVETTLWGGSRESPLVPWIIGGATVAAVGLAFACLLSLVDRLLAARRRHRLLVNLGIRPRQLAALGAWMFAVPYVAVCAASFLAGLAICALLVSPDTAMPWGPIGLTAAVTLAVGLVGSLSVAFLGARHALKESE